MKTTSYNLTKNSTIGNDNNLIWFEVKNHNTLKITLNEIEDKYTRERIKK